MSFTQVRSSRTVVRSRFGVVSVAVLALAFLLGVGGYARPVSSSDDAPSWQQTAPEPTPTHDMSSMAPMTNTVGAQGGMPAVTTVFSEPVATTPSVAELATQMGQMQKTLDLIVERLAQQSPAVPAAAAAVAVPVAPVSALTTAPVAPANVQALAAEMQAIDQQMGPLMLRLQAGVQGALTPDETAAVRTEVLQLAARMETLRGQMQAARTGNAVANPMAGMPMPSVPAAASTAPVAAVPATPVVADARTQTLARIEQMLVLLQGMQAELTGQAPAANAAVGTSAAMPGMAMPAAPAVPAATSSMPSASMPSASMPSASMPSASMPSASMPSGGMGMMDMMSMMDSMMMDMDMMMGMMPMDMPMAGSSMPSGSMSAVTPTPDPMAPMAPMPDM